MVLNGMGYIARGCWQDIPVHVPQIELDVFVVMPNHLHGILLITDVAGGTDAGRVTRSGRATRASPLQSGAAVR